MPIKLTDSNNDSEKILDIVEYLKEEDLRYFRVRNSDNIGINIKYIPLTESNWKKDSCDLFIFENPYLNAENDVFEVYEKTIDNEKIGWIFPVTILESNDNDFANTKNLNNYKYVAYQKLLEIDIAIKEKSNPDEYYKLSEIFKDSIVCLLLHKETTQKIVNFNIENYLLSFYNLGYLLFSVGGSLNSKPIYKNPAFIDEMRNTGKKRVTLIKSNFEISSNNFIYALFREHLLQSENYLIRFILLYQVIELLMESEFEYELQRSIDEFTNRTLSKNDLKEDIITSTNERALIGSIFNKTNINGELKSEFIDECNYLFQELKVNKKSKKNLADDIYNLRNVITHNLRILTNKADSLLKITEIFERIIIDLLINYQSHKLKADVISENITEPNSTQT